MKQYNPKQIEAKWQKKWEKLGLYKARDFDKRKKQYILVEFPYPSADGLHVGHVRSYSALDALARKKRMEGYNVLYPMGWDAFGLPTENYAIKTGIHPAVVTKKNTAIFKKQLKSLGLSFDWSREINTTDPKYYKWTQWIFLQMFKKGLAYQAKMPINWCPKCKIGLANEEVVGGKCERCGAETERREQKQWMLKITAYAERLLKDLEKVDYSERIKAQQINWIGKSEGATVKFKVGNEFIEVFTTRIDTIFGVTALVLAPEHELIKNSKLKIQNWDKIQEYIKQSKKKSELERTDLEKEKIGIPLEGVYAINPANNEKIPVWVGDYVIATYGGGAVMVVPAHDKRDFEFAKKYGLEIREVISGGDISKEAYIDYGILVNSGQFNGLKSEEAIKKITNWLEKNKLGRKAINYKLRDWIFSRQHYWGEPIPIIHCDACKNKKYRYLLLHGRHGSSQRDFFPWLKKELEVLGHQVYCPDLPDTENPKVEEQADFVIRNFKIDENTIIVGHSLGGAVALNILEKVNKKIARVVFVDSLIYPKFNDKRRPDLEKNFHWKFNFKKIKKLCDEFIDLADSDFPIIPREQFEEKNKLLNTRLLYIKPNAHHFNSDKELLVLEYAKVDGIYTVPEKDLPVKLPYVKKYKPTNTGESPLAAIKGWVNTKCPKCKGPAKRETDTMPNWAGSNWYYLRYCDPKNSKKLADMKKLKYWMPVDLYNGGMEHTTLHLLYSRFIYKFLYDIQAVPTSESYAKRRSHGMVLASDGRKMSKSFGNVINPDEVVKKYGADSLRLYEMFMGPFEEAINWNTEGLEGCWRFLKRVWGLFQAENKIAKFSNKDLIQKLHYTIKKISDDLENMKFNTAVSSMMEFINLWSEKDNVLSKKDAENFLKILAPFCPHVAEELWQKLSHKTSIFKEKWPKYDSELIKREKFELVIQINGRVRDKVKVDAEINQQQAEKIALEREKIKNWIKNQKPKKVIFVKEKLINIVV